MKPLNVTIWRKSPTERTYYAASEKSLKSHSAARKWAISQLGVGERTIYSSNTDRWAPFAEVGKRRSGSKPTRIAQPTYMARTVGEAGYW